MDRRDIILKHITKASRGIEIGPWFSPLAPKRGGFNCLTLDVFDSETLKQRAAADPAIPAGDAANVEDVDLVGSSTNIGDLVARRGESGTFDYIVSSHNFEHLSNPILFLQGCATALKPGGLISMAIPDHRACFDYFRPVTRLADWIEAYFEGRERPTLAQTFDFMSYMITYYVGDKTVSSFSHGKPDAEIKFSYGFQSSFDLWNDRREENDVAYYDTHCSVFTPSSFELLIKDAAYLGLIPFEVFELFDAGGEFHAHLRLIDSAKVMRPSNYDEIRAVFCRRIKEEEAQYSETSATLKALQEKPPRVVEKLVVDPSVAAQLEAQRSENELLRKTIEHLKASTSWRLTAPLRAVVTAARARPK